MALIDKASLLMVPSTYEDGTLYNILPSGNKAPDETGNHNAYDQTRADFTFSRGSNLAATRVNANGLIEKGRENLLLVSNSFNSGVWLNDDTTETSGFEGYDGTNDAWKLVGNTNASRHHIVQSKSEGGVNCWSLYAKASGHNYVQFGSGSTTNQYVNFDLSDGSIGSVGSDFFSAKTEDIGNGWYRLSVVDKGSTNGFYISLVSSKTAGWLESWSMPNSTDGIFIQNAQLEKGLVASTYLDSGATTATAGVLENTPRIDYSSGAGALLLEPQRTNLIPQSEYFGAWTNDTNTSLTANAIQSPSGFVDAYKLMAGTSVARQGIKFSLTPSGDIVQSVYAKKGEYSVIQITDGRNPNLYANFDLENGVIGSYEDCTPSIEPLKNDWYRCVITYNSTLDINVSRISIAQSTTQSRLVDFAGNGTDGIYIWGAQVESGSHVSSYVPTYGSAATRGADSCSVTGASDVIGQTEGTLYADFIFDGKPTSIDYNIMILGAIGSNYINIGGYNTSLYARVFNNTLQGTINALQMVAGTRYKVAVAYANNDVVMYVNGANEGTDTSASIPAVSQIGFSRPSFEAKTNILNAQVYKERLTNSELATLTTL